MSSNIVYTKVGCPYCDRALALLRDQSIPFEEISISLFPEKKAEMVEKSGGRTTVPQIFLQEKHIGGCDDLFALYKKKGTLA